MARQPFFSGNYGSALGQIDTRPIMQGAAAQAAMYQGLGQNIGGAIEKYQLNKEKREQSEAAATGTIQSMMQNNPQALQSLSQDPKFAKAMERIQTDQASPKDFSLINSASAAYRVQQNAALEQEGARTKIALGKAEGELTQLQAELERRIMGDKEQLSHSEAYGSELANDRTRIENELLKAKSKADKDRLERELQDHKIKMKTARQAFKANKADLKLFNETYDDKVRLAESQADAAEANLAKTAAETANIKTDELLTKAKIETEGVKGKTGQVRKFGGIDHLYNGVSWQPIAGQMTQKELDSTAFKIFGDELNVYRQETRNDKTGKINDPGDIDPQKERLLIMLKMGTFDELEGLEGLEAGVLDEIKGLMETGATSGTTDRVALARQALQDPNATPQVKEQAKKILQMAGQ